MYVETSLPKIKAIGWSWRYPLMRCWREFSNKWRKWWPVHRKPRITQLQMKVRLELYRARLQVLQRWHLVVMMGNIQAHILLSQVRNWCVYLYQLYIKPHWQYWLPAQICLPCLIIPTQRKWFFRNTRDATESSTLAERAQNHNLSSAISSPRPRIIAHWLSVFLQLISRSNKNSVIPSNV